MNLEDFNTVNYRLSIGKDPDSDLDVYEVHNIHTGVIEYRDTFLSRTIETIEVLDHRLQELVFNKETEYEQESDAVH